MLSTVVRGPGASERAANGTGPWRFVRRTRADSGVVLARVTPQRGYPDSLHLGMVRAEAIPALLASGALDCMPWITLSTRRQLAARSDVRMRDDGPPQAQIIDVAVQRAVWRDVRARIGLAHALDGASYVRTFELGVARRTSGLLSPLGPLRDAAVPPIAYDPVRARALLDSAGLHSGDTVRIHARAGRDADTTLGLPALLAASLRAIDRVPRFVVSARIDEALATGAVDLATYALVQQSAGEEAITELFSEQSLGSGGVQLPGVRPLELAYRRDTSVAARRAVLIQLNALVAAQQPVIPLWFMRPTAVARLDVEGCRAESAMVDRFVQLRRVAR
ncbi:MAG: ABC transporter substrate-binding protein [Gemmatimonadaceae bacterium]|nr:ABC transporter substrate-binding protein [Gemmatimonadaceae bacterium]